MQRKQIIILTFVAVLLIASTAAASALITSNAISSDKPEKASATPVRASSKETIHWKDQPVQAKQEQQVPACDDNNIVGTVLGGALGGVAGSQVGNGNGKTAATIGGTLGGAYLGNEYMPTRNATCR